MNGDIMLDWGMGFKHTINMPELMVRNMELRWTGEYKFFQEWCRWQWWGRRGIVFTFWAGAFVIRIHCNGLYM